MNLSLTSLIPTVIELTRFWENNWPHIWWYPYWYLGVPYRFLIGPVVPLLVILLKQPSNLNHLNVYLGLIIESWMWGAMGWYFFVRILSGDRRWAWISSLLFLLFPGGFWLLKYGTGLSHLAYSFVPWLFYFFIKCQEHRRALNIALCIFIYSLILLINPATMLTVTVGILIITLLNEQKNWGKNIIEAFFIWVVAFGIASIWYTPAYWLTVLFNPSLGGKSLAKVIGFVWQLLFSLLPLVVGLYSVQKKFKVRNRLTIFAIFWGGFFIFLTAIRMIFDIDFFQDWTAYGLEIQLFWAIITALFLGKLRYGFRQIVLLFIILILTISDIWLAQKLIGHTQATTYKNEISSQIALVETENKRFFFSGSPVFWLNSHLITPLMQVRGGKDQAAINPVWADGAYQIREGEATAKGESLLNLWLKVFGVEYVLIHQDPSSEPFRDFKNRERFSAWQLVSQTNGNILYKTSFGWARVADKQILHTVKPMAGDDEKALSAYVQKFSRPIEAKFIGASQIALNTPALEQDEVISLSVTYAPGWHTDKGRLVADPLGQLGLILDEAGPVTLTYSESGWSSIGGILIVLLGLLGLLNQRRLGQGLEKMLGQLHIADDEQENY